MSSLAGFAPIRRTRHMAWVILALAVTASVTYWRLGRSLLSGTDTLCQVRRVLDGDSIICADGRQVRYAGIDTPEIFQAYAERARTVNRRWVGGHRVQLIPVDIDRYGRIVAFVYRPDWGPPSINERLLAQGLAWVYYHPSVRDRWAALISIQRRAMRARRGLWSRVSRRPRALIGSAASLRFHTPDCEAAYRIYPHNRRRFSSLWEAFWAGYAPARDCIAD